MINKYNRIFTSADEDSNFWPTFTDMLATILLVVILMLCIYKSMASGLENDIANEVSGIFESLDENILVDETTGNIILGESLTFNTGKSELKPEGKKALKEFITLYTEAVYGKYGEYVDSIIVEGHTDTVGSYMYNLDLSQKRAYAVVDYLVGEEIGDYPYKDELRQDIVAYGRSFSDLITNTDGSENKDASRRVEIKFEINKDFDKTQQN